MINSHEVLEVYITVAGQPNAVVEQALLSLVRSPEQAKTWRRWCSMWNRDVELQGNFGYSIELWDRNPTLGQVEFTRLLVDKTKLHQSTSTKIARAIIGFASDGMKKVATVSAAYDWWKTNGGTAKELQIWSGKGLPSCYRCIAVFERNGATGGSVWKLWDRAREVGVVSRAEMCEIFAKNWSKNAVYEFVRICEVVSGVQLELPTAPTVVNNLITNNPGLSVDEYINLGVASGLRAPVVHKHVINYMQLNDPKRIVKWITVADARKLADLIPHQLPFTMWIDQLICTGVHPSIAYDVWHERFV